MKTLFTSAIFRTAIVLILFAGLSLNTQAKTKKIKIALLLDTSGSMDGLIDQAKSQLWSLVNELAGAKCEGQKPELQIALYEYGNDALPEKEGYIRMVTPLTGDLDKISEDLFKLTTNGGSEFCGYVIKTALRQLEWSADTGNLQVIFIAGNEPFTQGNVPYKTVCAEAKRKNIVVNTIFCGPYEEGIRTSWKHGADLTGGSYMSIEQDRKTVFVPSPYDDKIAELNSKMNTTYIEYGAEGKMKKASQAKQDMNAGSYGVASTVTRAVSKTKHVYKNSSWDLIDASDEKEFDVTKVPQAQLPESMKAMTQTQKIKFVADKKAEREKIKKEIDALNKQREAHVALQTKNTIKNDKMLDKSMINTIKKQAAGKRFVFTE